MQTASLTSIPPIEERIMQHAKAHQENLKVLLIQSEAEPEREFVMHNGRAGALMDALIPWIDSNGSELRYIGRAVEHFVATSKLGPETSSEVVSAFAKLSCLLNGVSQHSETVRILQEEFDRNYNEGALWPLVQDNK